MKTKRKQSGITLMEMTVVVAIVALLAVFGLPAIRAFVNSLESSGPAEAMINAALSSARAIALKEQRYAGIRFQKAYDPKGPLKAAQYMIFIIYEPPRSGITLTTMFRAIEGCEPIKLPETVGVMDLRVDNQPIIANSQINEPNEVNDTTAFSIIFSPAGKLVIHDVRVRNRDGYTITSSLNSCDDVFNKISQIEAGFGMFLQDDYYAGYTGSPAPPTLGFGPESSRNSFVIYDTNKFKQTNSSLRWTSYLRNLTPVYINPYTGTIIKQD